MRTRTKCPLQCTVKNGNPMCAHHMRELCALVGELIERGNSPYIGRTCDPTARRQEHSDEKGLDRLTVVYRAETAEEAMTVESELIRRFWNRIQNGTRTSFGAIREGANYVYVAYAR